MKNLFLLGLAATLCSTACTDHARQVYRYDQQLKYTAPAQPPVDALADPAAPATATTTTTTTATTALPPAPPAPPAPEASEPAAPTEALPQ